MWILSEMLGVGVHMAVHKDVDVDRCLDVGVSHGFLYT